MNHCIIIFLTWHVPDSGETRGTLSVSQGKLNFYGMNSFFLYMLSSRLRTYFRWTFVDQVPRSARPISHHEVLNPELEILQGTWSGILYRRRELTISLMQGRRDVETRSSNCSFIPPVWSKNDTDAASTRLAVFTILVYFTWLEFSDLSKFFPHEIHPLDLLFPRLSGLWSRLLETTLDTITDIVLLVLLLLNYAIVFDLVGLSTQLMRSIRRRDNCGRRDMRGIF